MKRKLFLMMLSMVTSIAAWGYEGEKITGKTVEGVTLTFCVTEESADHNSCIVGIGNKKSDRAYTYEDIRAILPNGGTVTIPEYLYHEGKEYIVRGIASYAFQNCGYLHAIAFEAPANITRIGSKAFQESGLRTLDLSGTSLTSIPNNCCKECAYLTTVSLPDGATIINEEAFDGCTELISVKLPSALETICNNALSSCTSLTSVKLPSSLTTIQSYAFAASGLTSISIPSGVTSIGINPFELCKDLVSISVKSGNEYFDSRNSCNAIIEKATNKLISGSKSTKIPGTVTSIGSYAFAGLPISTISIPMNVTSIASTTFNWCDELTSITVHATTPPTITQYSSFSYIPSIPLYVPNGCGEIYSNADGWKNSGFSEFIEMAPIVNIVFDDEAVKAICINNWDTNGDGELSEAEAAAVTSKDWPEKTFKGNTLITSFDELQYFTGLSEIPFRAFRECYNLTSIVIPDNVKSISTQAFNKCSNLSAITIPDAVIAIHTDAFSDSKWLNDQPNGMVYAGKVAYTFKGDMSVNTEIVLNEGTVGIADYAFQDFSELSSIAIPNSVTEIGQSAFSGCSNLNSITIPVKVTSIAQRAFSGCSGLTSAVIPYGVTTIGREAFSGCSSLRSVLLPDRIRIINKMTFSGCDSLTDIIIPDLVDGITPSITS